MSPAHYVVTLDHPLTVWHVFGTWSSSRGDRGIAYSTAGPPWAKVYGPGWISMTQAQHNGVTFRQVEFFVPEGRMVSFARTMA